VAGARPGGAGLVPGRYQAGIGGVDRPHARVDIRGVGICLLGPLTVRSGAGGESGIGPRDRVVLAALAAWAGDPLSVERLAEALWGEHPPASRRKVVQGCVLRLRGVLGAQMIETVPNGYRLAVAADEIDARRFERLLGRGRELLAVGEPDRAFFLTGQALELWRGRALIDLEHWEPARAEAGRLEELRLDAEELRFDAALQAGRYVEVLAEAYARVADAPLRERRWALLALAQYQAGRQGDALAGLRRARTVLGAELGLDPGDQLVAVERSILRQDPSLRISGVPAVESGRCPYLGLVPYNVSDAESFFGRDADVAACLHQLETVGVLAVVGASGSGKSSLLNAGVVTALRRQGRTVQVLKAGADLPEPTAGPPPVLVVDQCEEASAGTGYFAALASRADRAPLIVAVRADRLAEVSAEAGFARLIERGLHLLGPMDEAALRATIERPARQAGLLLEPGLVDLLLREVTGQPGALPLLSHTLRQTWFRREGRTLTVAGYTATGGIQGAVANTAEDTAHSSCPPGGPTVAGWPPPEPTATCGMGPGKGQAGRTRSYPRHAIGRRRLHR
jgi:DNA-binding SARP family transcriptional activator